MKKALYEKVIASVLERYEDAGDDENARIEALKHDMKAAAYPGEDTAYAQAQRLVQGGVFLCYHHEVLEQLKEWYGADFDESKYLTKNREWKIKGGKTYIWEVYKNHIAQAIHQLLDR